MPTLVEYYDARKVVVTQAVTDAATALDVARTERAQLIIDSDAASAAHRTVLAALAAAGAGLGEHGTWPDSEVRDSELQAALADERSASLEVRNQTYGLEVSTRKVENLEHELDAARSLKYEVDEAATAAAADAEEIARWRALLAIAPFDDPAVFADQVRNGIHQAAATAWLTDQVPVVLIDRANVRGTQALKVTERTEAIVAAFEDADDTVTGSPAPELRALKRRRQALFDYARGAEANLAKAEALLAEIPNGKSLSEAQHAEVNNLAKLPDRTTSLGLIEAKDVAASALADFDMEVEKGRAVALADQTVDNVDVDVEAIGAAETATGAIRADLVVALDGAEAAVLAEDSARVLEWETAVPESVWNGLTWFHQASVNVNSVAGTSGSLLADYDTAEAALVAALQSADTTSPLGERLVAPTVAAAHVAEATKATESLRQAGMVRGEPDDDRN